MRNNLVPVKRRDRNGLLRTVYVRAEEPRRSSSTSVPPVRVAPGAPARFSGVKLYESDTRPVFAYLTGYDLQPATALLDALSRHSSMGGRKSSFSFRCTPVQFCDVFSVASLDTAVALLDSGITSSGEAQAFLSEAGLDEFIEENDEVAAAVLRSGADPEVVISAYLSYYDDPDDFENLLRSRTVETLQRHPVWEAIKRGDVDPEHLRHIGFGRFTDTEERGVIAELLSELKRDPNARVQTADINDWIDRFGLNEGKSSVVRRTYLELCARFGADFTATLPQERPVISLGIWRVVEAAEAAGLDHDGVREAARFGADVCSKVYAEVEVNVRPEAADLIRLQAAGIDPEAAAKGYVAGRSAAQIIAIQSEGIAPGVSDGYL